MTRKFNMIAALIVTVAIIVTGTFAWQRVIEKNNEFIGKKQDVNVHDDFDPDTGLKDVYVENRGETTVFVRIKLDETMNLNSYTWRPGVNDWVTHTYGTSAEDCGHTNIADNKYFHDYFKWTMGGWKYYMPGNGSQSVVQDTNQYKGSEPGVKKTPDAKIITSAQFLAMNDAEQKAFIGWIYSEDGYAYWSQPLKKDEATGLLLHGVEALPILEDLDYYYAINVIVEIVDHKDIPMWTQGAPSVDGSGKTHQEATPDGKEVILIIAGGEENAKTPVADIKINGGDKTLKVGEDYTPTVTIMPPNSTDQTVWISSNTDIATVDPDTGRIVGVSVGKVIITVTAGGKSDSITVTITDSNGGNEDAELPVNNPADGFTPQTASDPMNGDGYYAKINFLEYNNKDPNFNVLYHTGSIHLEDIITDGNYNNITVEAVDATYAPYITVGICDRHGNKPSVIFSYEPTNDEFIQMQYNGGINVSKIPVQVRLVRDDGKTAVITVNMIYTDSLVTLDTSKLDDN